MSSGLDGGSTLGLILLKRSCKQNRMAVEYEAIRTKFERVRNYVTRDLDLVTNQATGGNYLAASLITCTCDAIAYLKFGKPYRGDLFFEELLPHLWQPVSRDLYDAIRHGIVHAYDTKSIAIGDKKLDVAISWGAKPHLHLSAAGDALYINVQRLATDLKEALDRFETGLKNDANLRDAFFKSMHRARELYANPTKVGRWEELLAQTPRYTETNTPVDGIGPRQSLTVSGSGGTSSPAEWQRFEDAENIENRNAGNGGDLVKHTVYLTVLDYLLARDPWSKGLRIRECHAGRGIYAIPSDDSRQALLECLYAPVARDIGIPLHDIQRVSQVALGIWPEKARLGWYSGSAVLNAWRLGRGGAATHRLDLYEFAPKTRHILRALFAALKPQLGQIEVRILPEEEDAGQFDGEAFIEKNISEWDSHDLVLLDPFAMWRQEEHQHQRDRYKNIFDQLIRAGDNSPLLILFWTWGRAFPVAEGDLGGTSKRVSNGYQDLREQLNKSGRHFIRVTWRWGLQFVMWILVPDSDLVELAAKLQRQCDALRDHLLARGCQGRLSNPNVQILID
jgi:hypothetical protein